MYATFNYDLATAYGESLRRDAHYARLARPARASRCPAASRPKRGLRAATLALAAATGLAACASAPAHHNGSPANNAGSPTSNSGGGGYGNRAADGGYSCLRDTGGGGGQCNAAQGLPAFTPGSGVAGGPADTPNECILVNGGDYNACNVGNSGRGDLPYVPVSPNELLIPGPGRP